MAKADASEQVKAFLRQLIKQRFWISVGLAAILAVVAYVMGSGPVQVAAKTETDKITGAATKVEKYRSPTVPNSQYAPIVEEKTQLATKDVQRAWKALYERQAPLLTWPETVQDRFRNWGPKWPENEDKTRVQLAYVDYTYAYPAYVDMVYKTFNPFNYDTGEGMVAAPPKDALLRPLKLTAEDKPDLGKVWAAQRRLWVQRTLLEVVAQVNKDVAAKDWDGAIVKEITAIEVGNPVAQDQQSLAKEQKLAPAEKILAPGETEEGEGGSDGAADPSGPMEGMKAMMGSMGGARQQGMGTGGANSEGAKYDDTIYYMEPKGENQPYKILPVFMTVLIDEDHVQNLLVELENSPMSIQVKEIDLSRPSARVEKPEKGKQPAGFGMMDGMMGGMMPGMMRRMMGEAGYGGAMGQMDAMMAQMGRMGGMRADMMSDTMAGMMPGMMGGRRKEERKGTDIRSVDRAKTREEAKKKMEDKKGPTLFDPYFNVVQLTLYGQARFYNPPPSEEPQSEGTSLGETTTPTADASGDLPASPGQQPEGTPPAAAAVAPNAPANAAAAPANPAQAPGGQPAAPSVPPNAAPSPTPAPGGQSAAPAAPGNAPANAPAAPANPAPATAPAAPPAAGGSPAAPAAPKAAPSKP